METEQWVEKQGVRLECFPLGNKWWWTDWMVRLDQPRQRRQQTEYLGARLQRTFWWSADMWILGIKEQENPRLTPRCCITYQFSEWRIRGKRSTQPGKSLRSVPQPTPTTPVSALNCEQYRGTLLGECGKHPGIVGPSLYRKVLRNNVLDATSQILQKRKERLELWISNTLATWWEELTHWKRPWCWERLKAGGEGDDGGWDGWMGSSTQWTWVWASSGR